MHYPSSSTPAHIVERLEEEGIDDPDPGSVSDDANHTIANSNLPVGSAKTKGRGRSLKSRLVCFLLL